MSPNDTREEGGDQPKSHALFVVIFTNFTAKGLEGGRGAGGGYGTISPNVTWGTKMSQKNVTLAKLIFFKKLNVATRLLKKKCLFINEKVNPWQDPFSDNPSSC